MDRQVLRSSALKIKALKGFKDVIEPEVGLWQYLEKTVRDTFDRFCFKEVRLPVLEETGLFARSIGEATDIVEKEMYTFVDKKITMRPEATASMLRAYIEHGMHVKRPVQRLFTIGPMFRHERPQKGRLRQFHQIDVEVVGSPSPLVDAELMGMGSILFKSLGIDVSLEVNSLGCPACRPAYRKLLLEYIDKRKDGLCSDCKRRSETNPLRVLDCKVPTCRELIADAPSMLDHLCEECSDHFTGVREGLDQLGVTYTLNKFMVRGLDYYCRTTFEFLTSNLGSQAAVAAGGRYDGLIEVLGGPKKTPGIGFAMGMERLVLLLQQLEQGPDLTESIDLWVAGLGEKAGLVGFGLANALRERGLVVGMDHEGRSLKSQMKQAHKAGARYVMMIGDSELESGKAIIRNMDTEEQQECALMPGNIADLLQIQ